MGRTKSCTSSEASEKSQSYEHLPAYDRDKCWAVKRYLRGDKELEAQKNEDDTCTVRDDDYVVYEDDDPLSKNR